MIEIKNVTKVYGRTVAVKNLTLTVQAGEVFGLLGPNGAGKTTTLKMLVGLLTPTEGSLSVAGADLREKPLEAKMASGFVPDKPFIYEKLTGREFLEFIRDIYRVNGGPAARKRQDDLIRMFSLESWLDELVENYSHGMRQKLIITATLVHNPRALIIDEPMVGLDARGMRQVKGLFRELAAAGSCVLLSTHTMSTAEEVCDRIGIINNGELVAMGSMDELRAKAGLGPGDDLEDVFLAMTGDGGENGPG
ncbi:MAG: ABC transporter ATP-binding protein [Candidatus Nitrospinota bacterium M3_3B_026]